MALLAAAGHRFVLVTAPDGEAGLTAAHLLPGLATRRSQELAAAARALGVARVVRLGYPDSGSDPRALRPGSFAVVPLDDPAVLLAAVLREEAAGILTV